MDLNILATIRKLQAKLDWLSRRIPPRDHSVSMATVEISPLRLSSKVVSRQQILGRPGALKLIASLRLKQLVLASRETSARIGVQDSLMGNQIAIRVFSKLE